MKGPIAYLSTLPVNSHNGDLMHALQITITCFDRLSTEKGWKCQFASMNLNG